MTGLMRGGRREGEVCRGGEFGFVEKGGRLGEIQVTASDRFGEG